MNESGALFLFGYLAARLKPDEGARLIDTLSPLPGVQWPDGEPVRGNRVVAAHNFGEQ